MRGVRGVRMCVAECALRSVRAECPKKSQNAWQAKSRVQEARFEATRAACNQKAYKEIKQKEKEAEERGELQHYHMYFALLYG